MLKYCIPTGENNYMLDTVAYNRLLENSELLDLVVKSLEYGYSYYKTSTQDFELHGLGAKVYDENCNPIHYKKNTVLPNFHIVDEKLKVEYVSCGASLMKYHTLLDGSAYSIDADSLEGEMFQKILTLDPKTRKRRPFAQHHDALIAESAMHNNCTLVTNDGALKDTVNDYFPSRAITIIDLAEKIMKEVKRLS